MEPFFLSFALELSLIECQQSLEEMGRKIVAVCDPTAAVPSTSWVPEAEKPSPTPSKGSKDSGYSGNVVDEEESIDIEEDMHHVIHTLRPIPGDYRCHKCGGRHWIQLCPQRDPNPMTPYQGNARSQGYFKCKCGKEWHSQNAYSNQKQRCERPGCGKWILSKAMAKLSKK